MPHVCWSQVVQDAHSELISAVRRASWRWVHRRGGGGAARKAKPGNEAGFVHAVRVTRRRARSALALFGVSGRAVPALVMMMVPFPVVAFPVAVAIPVAITMPARRNDDGGRRRWRDHNRSPHVD